MPRISVVIPAHNEEVMVPIATEAVVEALEPEDINYEIVFVNDGSKDRTWDEIEEISSSNPCVRGISFSRNFGKEAAIMAGLSAARGDCCVVLDCDLQYLPEQIVEMYRLWEEGYEIVECVKSNRGKESIFYKLAVKCFNVLFSTATRVDMINASDFKLLDRKAVDVLVRMQDKNTFFRAMCSWVGFKTIQIPVDVQERVAGKSSWSTTGLFRYAFKNVASFSSAPMQIVTFLGIIMLIVAVVFAIISLVQWFTGVALGGFTTVIILLLFIGSIVMLSLGIIGYYIARIFEEVRNRPIYIVTDMCGNQASE